MRRNKLKKVEYRIGNNIQQVHDRLATDLPLNADTAVTEVDDPLEPGARLRVIRSIRIDILAGMHARDQIDEAQFQAGRKWEEYHERAQVGGASAIDPTKEKVDGGKIPEPINDERIRALKALGQAGCVLTTPENALMWRVLGDRIQLGHLADQWCLNPKVVGTRFRDALEKLAILWGLA